ncbi:MAG: lysozyme, partial [Spirochaetia bacterium]|nr:lysozyme [Spirochaetia bacterium]
MQASKKCYDLVKKWEGYHVKLANGDCKSYLCPAGVATLGYGTTRYPNGVAVKLGDVRTEEQATEYLVYEVSKICEPAIDKYVKVPLTQGQYDSLTSFIYNCGVGAFSGSTLLQKLNRKEYNGAADELLRWVKGGGQTLPGLVSRRKEERDMFLSGEMSIPSYP